MEAVKQGSACVGCRVRPVRCYVPRLCAAPLTTVSPVSPLQSDTHVVIAALKRATSELSSFQRKIFKIDDHMGIAASGLIGDGRVLSRYMRNECINHRRVVRPVVLRRVFAAMEFGLCLRFLDAHSLRRSRRFVYDAPLPVGRLVAQVADKSQANTQRSWKRPYGVGLLVAGYDKARKISSIVPRVCERAVFHATAQRSASAATQ